ncbi:MAG: hypothetical protein M1817_002998 [Caeruleum heppii]|nr:MAG: hypothetical protein M1817_002998 [Caeruleum heppii]
MLATVAAPAAAKVLPNGMEIDEEDDEETLQLQLQAIEAKLKLKKLRQAKSKDALSTEEQSVSCQRTGSAAMSGNASKSMSPQRVLRATQSQPGMQVPLSPPRRKTVQEEPRSPGRVLLGIDKGLTGRDVSLRRAPNLRGDGGSTDCGKPLSQASAARNLRSGRASVTAASRDSSNRPKTFSERIAESRTSDRDRKQKEMKVRKMRSRGFGVDEKEISLFKDAAAEEDPFIEESRQTAGYSREQVLQAYKGENASRGAGSLSSQRSDHRKVDSSRRPLDAQPSSVSRTSSTSTLIHHPPSSSDNPPVASSENTNPSSSQFESFSSIHLSKRLLPHTLLTRTFTEKTVFLLPDLLKNVKAPEFELPDTEADHVVIGIVASKSAPREHQDPSRSTKPRNGEKSEDSSTRGKYMVLTLTDLKWEMELFLFSTSFEKFWKLTPGTLVAILNPSVMPPPPHKRDTGQFSLTLNSSDDTLLEIGTARDLGFCKAVKRDGKICESWVDKRHTEFCAFHVDSQVRKAKASRMEVNTMTGPYGDRGRGGRSFSRGSHSSPSGLKREGPYHDRETHSTIYIAPSSNASSTSKSSNPFPHNNHTSHHFPTHGRSTASLLDDVDPDAFHARHSKAERLRRRLATREKEREIARKLGTGGDGAGSDYLRVHVEKGCSTPSGRPGDEHAGNEDVEMGPPPILTAKDLGLHMPTAGDVRLSPLKTRKRTMTTSSSIKGDAEDPEGTGPKKLKSDPLGWSGAFKRGFSPTRQPSPTRPSTSTSIPALTSVSTSIPTSIPPSTSTTSSTSTSLHNPPSPTRPSILAKPSSGTLSRASHNATKEIDTASRKSSVVSTTTTDSNTIRKKTRFVTPRGIREAGRESLGVVSGGKEGGREDGAGKEDGDEDDGLDII